MAARIGVEAFGPQAGSAYLAGPEDVAGESAPVVEDDGGELALRDPDPAAKAGEGTVAFVDGVRRGDGRLSYTDEDGDLVFGVAGAHGVGAVRCDPGTQAVFDRLATRRLVVWGSGCDLALPEVAGGFAWQTAATASTHPEGPLAELQQRMREAEGRLAEALCAEGVLTVIDGPLNYVRSRDLPVVGYVKTHHQVLLAPQQHRQVPALAAGQRTSLFAKRDDVYACYLRIAEAPAWSGAWSGIARLEVPASVGLWQAAATADRAAWLLPQYAGVAHRDSRAPVNLQPVAALESRLRHLLGDARLAIRALRTAALQLNEEAV